MQKKILAVSAVMAALLCVTAFSKNMGDIKPPKFDPPRLQAFDNEHLPWGYPTWQSDQVLYRDGYSMGYNYKTKTADWVCYHVKAGYYKKVSYKGWASDPAIPAAHRAAPSDYKKIKKKPSYEMGQLFPEALARGSKGVAAQAFYLSNALPMDKALTTGPLAGLNKQIKYWAARYGDLNVCAGPVFTDDDNDRFVEYDKTGENSIAVPDAVYVVVARYSGESVKPLAFVIPNDAGVKKQQAGSYLTTVDRVEELTGFDFFPRLPDALESRIESEKNIAAWK